MGRKQNQKSSLASRVFAQTCYDPRRPGAYGGVEALRLVTRLKRPQVKEWLSHQRRIRFINQCAVTLCVVELWWAGLLISFKQT